MTRNSPKATGPNKGSGQLQTLSSEPGPSSRSYVAAEATATRSNAKQIVVAETDQDRQATDHQPLSSAAQQNINNIGAEPRSQDLQSPRTSSSGEPE